VIELRDLPERVRQSGTAGGSGVSPGNVAGTDLPIPGTGDDSHWPSLAEVEQAYLHRVLEHVEGNKQRAARILGIGRKTLYRKLGESESDS
jgi:DNA-binding NtrC family response regulator